MPGDSSLGSFDHPGCKWQVPVGRRQRFKPNRLIVHSQAGKRHLEMEVNIRFLGESVEYAANQIVAEDLGNHRNRGEAEIVEIVDEIEEEEFQLDSTKCPSCRSAMDYEEVVMECKGQCVVCYKDDVTCVVSCHTYSEKHGLCKAVCYQKYLNQHNKIK